MYHKHLSLKGKSTEPVNVLIVAPVTVTELHEQGRVTLPEALQSSGEFGKGIADVGLVHEMDFDVTPTSDWILEAAVLRLLETPEWLLHIVVKVLEEAEVAWCKEKHTDERGDVLHLP